MASFAPYDALAILVNADTYGGVAAVRCALGHEAFAVSTPRCSGPERTPPREA